MNFNQALEKYKDILDTHLKTEISNIVRNKNYFI
jgi:hypothetical protein